MDRHIYVNGRFLTQQMTGVHRYAYMICSQLLKIAADVVIVCPNMPLADYDVEGWPIQKWGYGRSHWWEQLVLPFYFINKKDYILLNLTGLAPIVVAKKILTIHDLAFLENPKWFSKTYYYLYRTLTPLCARTSEQLLTVSEFSKGEILRHYPFLKNKPIHVVPCAVGEPRFEDNERDDFLLAVSSMDPRKNFRFLVDTICSLPGQRLKIVGGRNSVFAETQIDIPDNVELLGRVSDKELEDLYLRAKAFVCPSVFEGFGIPPLEAMNHGCIVLVSDIPAHREVCGSAAIYFDTNKKETLLAAMDKLNRLNPAEQLLLRKEGRLNVARFSWKSSAERLLTIIRK